MKVEALNGRNFLSWPLLSCLVLQLDGWWKKLLFQPISPQNIPVIHQQLFLEKYCLLYNLLAILIFASLHPQELRSPSMESGPLWLQTWHLSSTRDRKAPHPHESRATNAGCSAASALRPTFDWFCWGRGPFFVLFGGFFGEDSI